MVEIIWDLLRQEEPIPNVRAGEESHVKSGTMSTRDHAIIRQWAERRQAEPATGEATASGAATVDVHDGGAGVRFNFPGVGRFRPISWEEWFENFDRHALTFLYEENEAGTGPPSASYRILKTEVVARYIE